MIEAILGLGTIFIFGLYVGHAPQSKWPRREIVVACLVALLLVCGGLLWAQKSQGACAPAGYTSPYGSPCKSILTRRNIAIGYGGYIVGLALGLCYQLATTLGAKRSKAPARK